MTTTDQRLEDLQELCETLNRSSNSIRERFDEFQKEVKGSFAEVYERFDASDKKQDEFAGYVSARFNKTAERLDRIERDQRFILDHVSSIRELVSKAVDFDQTVFKVILDLSRDTAKVKKKLEIN